MRSRLAKSMQGQTAVIIALALVGILAMVALAVDGSMVYSDRRNLQSAADNAAMSAAGMAATTLDTYDINHQTYSCTAAGVVQAEMDAIDAAIARAASYGFPIDTDISDNNGVQITCRVIATGPLVERYLDIQVKILSISRTSFTRFILPDGVANMVEAVSRVVPRRSLSMGNAIAALGPDCPPSGLSIGGNDTVNIAGGGIFSNSCLKLNGASDITITVDVGGIGYVTDAQVTGNVDLNPPGLTPQQSTELLPEVEIPTPDCLSLPDFGSIAVSGTQTIDGGRYTSIALSGSGHLIMNPGLYCIYGNFTTNGSQIVEVNPASPNEQGITIYMASGNITFNGNSTVTLRAPSVPQPPAIEGMLIYMPPNNPGTITLTGTLGSAFRGTVYAPRGTINIGGTADIPYATEFVGYTVNVSGNAVIDITDNAQYNYTRPPLIELRR